MRSGSSTLYAFIALLIAGLPQLALSVRWVSPAWNLRSARILVGRSEGPGTVMAFGFLWAMVPYCLARVKPWQRW